MLQGYMANELDQLIVIIYTVVCSNATLCLLDLSLLVQNKLLMFHAGKPPLFFCLNCERWYFLKNVRPPPFFLL